MRFLILDAKYSAFLEGVYRSNPRLAEAPYAEQLAEIHGGMFGEAGFQADALRAMGHEADVIVSNAYAAQRAWAREHGVEHLIRGRRQPRLRRGFIPWLSSVAKTPWEVILAQVADYRPDVVYVGILDTMPQEQAGNLRRLTRFLVAQVATTVPNGTYRDYDLVVSSIPGLVERFRGLGIPAEMIPLAFEPRALKGVPPVERDIPISFVGSLTDAYQDRVQILESVARSAPLHTWTADAAYLPLDSPVVPTIRGSAFGRDMYAVLARSQITLNTHGKVSGPDANNLRLFEATGMGALLITDRRRNLGDFFDVGTEIAAYDSPKDAAAMVTYYLDHPDETTKVASAGQARTLRDHTWLTRMRRVIECLNAT